MIEETLKKVVEHVDTFPERNGKLEARLKRIENLIKEGLSHPKASSQTITMYGELQDEVRDIKHLLFGTDQHTIGMVQKVDEMHTILVQAKGAKGILQFIVLGGAAASAVLAIKYFWSRL